MSPLKLTLAAVDSFLVFGAVNLAEHIRYGLIDIQGPSGYIVWIARLLVPIIFMPVLLGVGGYQPDAMRDLRVFAVRIAVAIVISGTVLSALMFLFPSLPLWRSILVLTMTLTGLGLVASHYLFILTGSDQLLSRRVIILGAGHKARDLLDYADTAREAGLNVVDVVALPGEETLVKSAVILENLNNFDAFAFQQGAEMVLVSADGDHPDLPLEALIACKLGGIEVKERRAFYEQVRGYVSLESVKAEWIIFSEGFKGGNGIERAAKRFLDILVGIISLILSLPIMLVTALAIKLTSRGPVFYRQERVGLHGQVFRLFKFRSMRVDAEKEGQPQWAQHKDPRVTKVGAFIRRTRIDELPQILNVLSGNMSFVGPRPERPYFVEQLEKEIPFYRERHCLKPGITGWAQIQYPYGASVDDARRKLEYDLYYIKNYSLFLDLLIILQTARVILFPIGVR
ncbi:TIGR03013 family XrtA/PEP-CTERM system glycosyltransferase [Kordiimonas marina]|uniref:TIGR03013 family XrtA/PEP-CTERM system glycosyltransferase n=1 Tax=Kordiimonas marina TaxID=2872312 RepID=UPI001FF5C254|nr:TIGR03013 family PEP-CTERM/XrtA system glycosyltransferase [Kordiimonas marina]